MIAAMLVPDDDEVVEIEVELSALQVTMLEWWIATVGVVARA
jgi:hypothetical protein